MMMQATLIGVCLSLATCVGGFTLQRWGALDRDSRSIGAVTTVAYLWLAFIVGIVL